MFSNIAWQCMFPTWYLAIDMQLFLVSPILIYPLWRWRKCGISLLTLVTIGCHVNILFVFSKDNSNTNHPHYKPWIRAPPYLVGIWTGWFLHITKQSQFKLSKITVAMGWMISIILGAAVTYGEAYNTNQSVLEMSSELTATFGPVHRIAWACFVAWIIFACSHGYGGVLNRILSWKGFLPLSRLTYCVYLIHFDYVLIYYSALRKRFYYRMFEEFITLFGIFFYLFALAFFISVSLEVPFLRLEKLIFSSKPKRNTLSIEHHTS
uniref:Acyltransferase 3 domain-containing protein n=1 Tax=Daphnia galeata TaxID=27404 RepID=A0A8J2RTQ4_9CRUS|nr:unnamed protein product [Daphnia galeata]